jgi:hypothetical protein
VAIAAAGVLAWAGVDSLATPVADCDNMAGECLRDGQKIALYGLGALWFVVAGLLLWTAARLLLGRGRARTAACVVSGGVLLAIAVLLVRPAGHLDNRFDGWLSEGAVRTVPSSRG